MAGLYFQFFVVAGAQEFAVAVGEIRFVIAPPARRLCFDPVRYSFNPCSRSVWLASKISSRKTTFGAFQPCGKSANGVSARHMSPLLLELFAA